MYIIIVTIAIIYNLSTFIRQTQVFLSPHNKSEYFSGQGVSPVSENPICIFPYFLRHCQVNLLAMTGLKGLFTGKMTRTAIVVLLLAFCHTDGLGKGTPDYTLSQIDYQDGLSHSAVLSIFQDRSGLMWFGTYDGLNCYDGREMTVYRSDFSKEKTFSNNVIHTVCQADGNSLWVNNYLSLNRFSLDNFHVEDVYRFGGGGNYSIYSNSEGNTWLLDRDSLFYYNTFHRRFLGTGIKFPESRYEASKRVFVSESGELWYFPDDTGRINIFSLTSFSSDSSSVRLDVSLYDFHSHPVEELFYQDGTVCFIDSGKDLYMYDLGRRSKVYIRNVASLKEQYGDINGIIPFYEDIFIGFRINGLVRLLASDRYSVEEVDKDMRIYGLFKDSVQGILWIATDGKGAVQYAHKSEIAASLMLNQISGSLSRQVRSLLTDRNGDLWFGTKGDGLVRIPSYKAVFEDGGPINAEVWSPEGRFPAEDYVRSNHEFQVYSLRQSRFRDGFWAGTGETGLFFYSLPEGKLVHVENLSSEKIREIHAVEEDGGNALYLATSGDGFLRAEIEESGGRMYMRKVRKFSFYDKGHGLDMFYPMLADGDSLLWLGSRGNGLVKFNRSTHEYQVISFKDMLGKSVDDILSLCKSSTGIYYIGTTSGLVCMSIEDGHIHTSYVGREQGLQNDMIHGILEDERGFLWLATSRGLIKYDIDNCTSHSYWYSSGVSLGEFSDDAYYCSPDGELLFGGVDGLLRINRETVFSPGIDRDVILRGMKIGRKSVDIGDCYETRNGERRIRIDNVPGFFSFTFGVPDFLTAKDIEYSYMLDGHDREWSVFSGSNEASFASVPPGRYVLRIRYRRDVLDIDYKTFSIPVRIVPPWYGSSTAIIIYVLFALFVSVSLIIYLHRKGIAVLPSIGHHEDRAAPDRELADRLAVIWHSCERIRSDNVDDREKGKALDIIKDAMSGMLDIRMNDGFSRSCLPSEYVINGEENISGIVHEVAGVVSGEGLDISGIDLSVPDKLYFPVYVNAFRRIIYFCMKNLAGSKASMSVSCGPKDVLSVEFCADGAEGLRGKIVSALGPMLDRIQAEVKDGGDRTVLLFRRVEGTVEKNLKNTIILLGASSDLSWLIADLLSSSYSVRTVGTPEEAFKKLSFPSVSLFMVDMRMFEGDGKAFLDLLYRNREAVAKVPFVPMFTWNTEQSVCRELILISDAYMVLPYDIQMLRNVVHKAIFGKGDIVHMQFEDISRLGGKLFCTNDEDAVFVRKVLGIIEENLDRDDLGTLLLADRVAMSASRFYRKAKRIFGISPEVLIKNYRMEKAAFLLQDGRLSISDVVTDVGISSRSYFYKEFSSRFGMTPGEYRDKFCPNSTETTINI